MNPSLIPVIVPPDVNCMFAMLAMARFMVSMLMQSFMFIAIHWNTRLLLYGLNTTLLPPLTRLSACLLILLNVAVLTLVAPAVGGALTNSC